MARLYKIRGMIYLKIKPTDKCTHPQLVYQKYTGETICAKCERTIYLAKNHNPDNTDRSPDILQ